MRNKTRKNFRDLKQYKQQVHKDKKKVSKTKPRRNIGKEILEGIKEIKRRLQALEYNNYDLDDEEFYSMYD